VSNIRLFNPGVNDSFESALSRFFSPIAFDTEVTPPKLRIDVSEKDDSYLVRADIPGVKKEDIKVRIDNNMVQIDAEVKEEKESKGDGGKVLRSERYFGSVSRVFTLAQDVDDAKAQAKYADGVLTLELPKRAVTKSKQLEVH
jgi:HSP20 family protein